MHQYSVIQKNLMSLFSGKAAIVQACWTCGCCTGVRSRTGCLCAGACLSGGGAAPCRTQSVPDGPGAGHSWALGGAGDASGKRDLRKGKPSLAEGGNQCEKQPCEHPGRGGGGGGEEGSKGGAADTAEGTISVPSDVSTSINKKNVKWRVFYWCRHKINKNICFYLVHYSLISYISGSIRH